MRLQHDVARQVRLGYPWIYRDALGSRPLREQPGAPIELVDWDGDFVARGVYDGESSVAVRVFTRNPDQRVDAELMRARVREAVAVRRRLLDWDAYESMRLINGEADGLPGIVVERYGDFLVSQIYTPALEELSKHIYDALEAELAPAAIYEQRRFRPQSGQMPRAAELIRGVVAPVEFEVREGPLKFWVDVTAPLSTGLFADLRDGRRAVADWSKDRRVLNLFSYTGAISVYAAHGGATEVAAVDVAAKAHARARKNFALNGFDPETPDHIVGDTFKVLARFADRGRRFDMVVIDPPAFGSPSRGGKAWSAVKDYGELVAASLDVLEPGGLLMAASSTRKIGQEEFEDALADGATRAHTDLRIIDRRSLPADFPTLPGFPEGNYLKVVVCMRG
ncbi:class I SAM-dependent rRNA methyltransferase [Haliangium ochraceum]|uniref:class I SAM-dependent rRNA methyltransferase n=1 Tax=Haliangium ochraceum TaxID=80816 RepID=UPI0002F988C7|nr:class I SAM-dependent rRNA methyltransferase [Haliangium ochraceum]